MSIPNLPRSEEVEVQPLKDAGSAFTVTREDINLMPYLFNESVTQDGDTKIEIKVDESMFNIIK